MRRPIKIYRNLSYEWPDDEAVPARSLAMKDIDAENAHLVRAIREDSLARVFVRFSDEGRHGVFALVDGVPAGHAWITAPIDRAAVVNSYARLEAGECLIHYCFVDPRHRGRGIYREMLHELTAWALDSGAGRVLVDTGRDNISSQRGIVRAGFAARQETTDIVVARRLVWSRRRPFRRL
ncbi:GNAT family N-acetyltransferase [Microbacterium sp. K24]|uniref:GNAT family N-acetyltransferase n=1 Tax=Microbacterium sp. K24 TaxID=2305446 RepID=UPI00109C51D7|nr:GNAT family N-acetyltransferase [Microbacterium sp. K24]